MLPSGCGLMGAAAPKNKAWALFGSIDYAFTDRFDVRAGARWSHDQRDFSANRLFGFTGPIGPLTSSPSDSRWSGDLTASFKVNDDVNVYARAANGFRAPSVQGRITFGNDIWTVKPETITSYEVGLKVFTLDKRLRFNADVYSYTMRDQQLTAVGGATNIVYLLNAKRTEGYGAEFDLEAFVTPNFILAAGGNYIHTRLKDKGLGVAPCGGGTLCHVLDPVDAGGLTLVNGNSLPNSPEWIGTITARYGIPVGDGGEFFRLHRLELPQRDQLLPVRIDGIPQQAVPRRRAARRLQLGPGQARDRAVRAATWPTRRSSPAASSSTTARPSSTTRASSG